LLSDAQTAVTQHTGFFPATVTVFSLFGECVGALQKETALEVNCRRGVRFWCARFLRLSNRPGNVDCILLEHLSLPMKAQKFNTGFWTSFWETNHQQLSRWCVQPSGTSLPDWFQPMILADDGWLCISTNLDLPPWYLG